MNKLVSIFIFLLAGLAAIFLQGTLLKSMLPDYLIPNFFVSIVVFLAFYENSPFGALLVFLLGLECDLYGGTPLLVGPSAAALLLAYGVLASLSQRVYVESGFAVFVMAVFSAVLYSTIYSILIFEFNDAPVKYFSVSLTNSLATGLVTPVIFKLFRKSLLKGAQTAHPLSSRQRAGGFRIKNV